MTRVAFPAHKVILIGESSVGKSALLAKFSGTNTVPVTVGAALVQTRMNCKGGVVPLSIWDTAGGDDYRSMMNIYFRGAALGILVFSLSDRQSFERIPSWYDKAVGQGVSRFMLVANKSDEQPEVDFGEARAWAREKPVVRVIKTSAQTGANVMHLFHSVAEVLADQEPEVLQKLQLDERRNLADRARDGPSFCAGGSSCG
jgi:Ras-related protein Rab-5C